MEEEYTSVDELEEFTSVDVLVLEVVSVNVVESSLASIAEDDVVFCSLLFMLIFSSSCSAGNISGWTK